MDKEQKKNLVDAWGLMGRISEDLHKLATMNTTLAYGCIRSAETLIDMIMVDKLREEQAKADKEVE